MIKCIVIPCYNEETRLPQEEYKSFLETQHDTRICFVNDGSSDKTLIVLNELKSLFPEKINVLDLPNNQGKAEAVRQGVQFCNQHFDHELIAYLDADLATTLVECNRLMAFITPEIQFVFGSRILKIGSKIERGKFRFLVGRMIATVISNILNLKVYDTQCGCKIFTKDVSHTLFKESFLSTWLFDVELFKRYVLMYGHEEAQKKMLEVPLKSWIDKGESKVNMTYFFRMWWDLFQINRAYNSKTKSENH
ncbi:MAG: glycosyltransferase [Bacteroidia bacterium]|nr:glycosyltransferase [Bacteroidia bacterium]NNL33341.1 glycosyltransferase [Flavobacteriaceae bacterium]